MCIYLIKGLQLEGLHSGGGYSLGARFLMLQISDVVLCLLALGMNILWVYTLRVYSLELLILDLDLYLLVLGVYTLGVYSLALPILDLELYLLFLKALYREPFKPTLFRESNTKAAS